jgi:hypothetical protein
MPVHIVPIHLLWLPILLSAVIVFVASSIIHMILGYHSNDFRPFPKEDEAADALRKMNLPAGQYAYPKPNSSKEMNSPEFKDKVKKGPGIILTVWPGGSQSMTASLIQWFVFLIVVGVFVAYVTGRASGWEATYLTVFRFAGATAFACHVMASWHETIWYKRPWTVSLKNTFDGLVYALLTAGVFGWLWPR